MTRWPQAFLFFFLVLSGAMLAGCTDGATTVADTVSDIGAGFDVEADAADTIASTCSETDRFVAVDEGALITHELMGMTQGVTIADNTSYLTDDGEVRLYVWAGDQGGENTGAHSARTSDGVTLLLEDGLRIPPPYGHPKLFRLSTGQIRMFHLIVEGLGSHISEDGLNFTQEDGMRISSEDAGLDRIGGMSVVALPDGGYRGYFSNLGIPGVAPQDTVDQIKSATSGDLLTWVMDGGVRLGEESTFLTGKTRQPFALTRSNGCITLFYQRVDSVPTKLYYATAPDGVTFTQEFELGIEGWDGAEAGANIQQLADGSHRLFFDAQDGDLGNHIRTATFALQD